MIDKFKRKLKKQGGKDKWSRSEQPKDQLKPEISFISSHYNRPQRLKTLVNNIIASCRTNMEIIIADYGPFVKNNNFVKTIRIRGQFYKTKALNKAFALSVGKIIFFVDVDMIVPNDFDILLLKKVKKGVAYFPMCFSTYEGKLLDYRDGRNGWWRTGFGMCGFVRSDFNSFKFNENFAHYGGEDTDLYLRSKKKLKIIRERCPGLYHVWHPKVNW